MKKYWLSLAIMFITLLTNASMAFGQVVMDSHLKPGFAPSFTAGTNNSSSITGTIQVIAGSLIYVAGPIAVLMIAIGGFRYVTSRGDSTQMENAKKTILYAIIGLVVIIISWAIAVNIALIFSTTNQPAAPTK